MTDTARCLNCGDTLTGRFCAACGQRAVAPHPTIRELAGDAWDELTGYDGRIASTFRGLLSPGLLTKRYIEGQRARYLTPVRLYLIVSVVYFVVAAAAPERPSSRDGAQSGRGNIHIDLSGRELLTPELRERLRADSKDYPWVVRTLMNAVADDPVAFRTRLFTVMARVFFAMLPVFAGIVALFYRRWTFPVSLVFATHLHAFAFAVLTFSELAKFARSAAVEAAVDLPITIGLVVYAIAAFRKVFGGGLLKTLGKAAAIGVLYLLTSLPAFFIILLWAAIS